MLGQTIPHYRIVSQLGVGGMGIVYEGLDPRLGRPVALKFVPEELAHDLKALERLRSEARTASGLNHPNICTIYDVGEHEGRPFIVMELLKGQTLRDRIGGKSLKMHEAVDIGIQVADALDCAHQANVIHRDIKPANLFMVERGQVKILDFGLAKLLSADFGTQLTLAPTVDQTAAGIALGTVAYMSPEQVQGETLDGRTDLFSLGVVLYECATGHQPFKGKTSAVVFASILTQAPTAPIALNPEVPSRLQDVINNCLEKDREMRYQEAASLRADLKRVKRDIESGASSTARTGAVPAVGSESRPTVGVTTVNAPSGATADAGPSPMTKGRVSVWLGTGIAAVAVAGSAISYFSRDQAPVVAPEPIVATAPASSAPPASAPAPVPAVDSAARARFDAAIADAGRLIAQGDLDGATRAINVARDVEPGSQIVADLSTKLMESYRTQAEAARRSAADTRRPSVEPTRPSASRQATAPAPPPLEPRAQSLEPRVQSPDPRAQSVEPRAQSLEPIASPPAAAPTVVPPPTAARVDPTLTPTPSPERRAATPPSTEDDDAAIRRVVAIYARAIETKDLALFRSVKPNLTAGEQRRIEDGFRAVTSQRVSITVQSIEHRGQEATVRLLRHDVIQAGGRQQTADSQQTMTFTHAGGAWVIREIGR